MLVGDHDYTTGADTAFSALYNVLSITSHPYYNVNTNANDIAVVKTMTTITYNAGVAPACLPFGYAQTAFDNTVLEVPGWGTLEVISHCDAVSLALTLSCITVRWSTTNQIANNQSKYNEQ